LLAGPFHLESATFASSVLGSCVDTSTVVGTGEYSRLQLFDVDIKRLTAYSKNLVDFHLVTDLLQALAKAYFLGGTFHSSLVLSPLQRVLLVAMGLQYKTVEEAEREFHLPVHQLLGLFNKAIRRLVVGLSGNSSNNNVDVDDDAVMVVAGTTTAATATKTAKPMEDVSVLKEGQIISLKRESGVVSSSSTSSSGGDVNKNSRGGVVDGNEDSERFGGRSKKHKRR
jgi:N-acetyltransferase 10